MSFWAGRLDELRERIGKRVRTGCPPGVGEPGEVAGRTGAPERAGNDGPSLSLKTMPQACRCRTPHLRRRTSSAYADETPYVSIC